MPVLPMCVELEYRSASSRLASADVDATDVADDAREPGAERIGARQVRHDVDAGKRQRPTEKRAISSSLSFRRSGTLSNGRLVRRSALKRWMSSSLSGTTALSWFEHRVHVRNLLGHDFEAERRDIVGQQHAVAIVDQAAARHDACGSRCGWN